MPACILIDGCDEDLFFVAVPEIPDPVSGLAEQGMPPSTESR